jgi:hypothetical protein
MTVIIALLKYVLIIVQDIIALVQKVLPNSTILAELQKLVAFIQSILGMLDPQSKEQKKLK